MAAHCPGSSPRTNQLPRAFAPPFLPVCLLVLMNQLSGRSTNNSAAAMLDSSATSSAGSSSSVASSVVSSAPVTTSPPFVMTAQDLSQAFSRALRDSLPQILAAVQNQTSQLTASNVTHPGEAGYKNKGWAIRRSGGPGTRKPITSSSIFCRSWNNGSCACPYGQCRYRHHCEKCEGEHPSVNCPFRASASHAQPLRSSTPPWSKRQRR